MSKSPRKQTSSASLAVALLNRDNQLPADGQYVAVPLGEFPIAIELADGTQKTIVQVVDQAAITEMANRHEAKGSPDLLIDYDHFSHNLDKPSLAAGWSNSLAVSDQALTHSIRWSNSGKASVEGLDYRFLSPVFNPETAVPLGGNRFRVTEIVGFGLTNDPNIKTMPPLTNRATAFSATNNDTMKPKLIEALGLSTDATDQQVIDAVLANRADAQKLSGLTTQITDLSNRNKALTESLVESDLAEFAAVITEEAKPSIKAQLLANRDGTLVVLRGFKAASADGKKPEPPLHNRSGAKAPTGEQIVNQDPSAEEIARARKISNRAAEIAHREGCSYQTAWAQASGEFPEPAK